MHDVVEAIAGDLRETVDTPAEIDLVDFHATARISPADFPPVADYPEEEQFMFDVVGNAANNIAQDGDKLLCVRAGAAGAEPQDGDLVVIEDGEVGNCCVAIRRLRRIGELCEFRHESNDPDFQTAPLICDMRGDEGKVRILGKVLFACRRLGA